MGRLFVSPVLTRSPAFVWLELTLTLLRMLKLLRNWLKSWMAAGEEGLLAIDDGLLERMDPAFVKWMGSAERMPFLVIPGGEPLGSEASRKYRIAEMIRRAIGFHITFKGEEEEVKE